MTEVGRIDAVLTLNAGTFNKNLEVSTKLVQEFQKVVKASSTNAGGFSASLRGLLTSLEDINERLTTFTAISKETESFNKFANGVKALASAVEILGTQSENASVGIEKVKEIIASWGNAIQGTEVHIKNITNVVREMGSSGTQSTNALKVSFEEMKQEILNSSWYVTRFGNAMTDAEARVIHQTQQMRNEYRNARREMLEFANGGVQAFNEIPVAQQRVKAQVEQMRLEFEKARADMLKFAETGVEAFNMVTAPTVQYAEALEIALPSQRQMIINATGIAGAMEEETVATEQATQSHYRNSNSMDRSTASANKLSTATGRLGKALSSLKMIGTMVGSMLAYNFAHKLLVATGETIHAKSEMEGYFKMLHFGQSDIDDFNNALTETVQQFQRVNKYSLGETISSIGVEFNLSTEEMKKAMKVTSMITSEYLRAGRNANEASLAVKDVLQGQFQRLSRETGVKGEQLKEAGWSGDTTDVLGLMEALEKVGESRNWDVFAEKANSLNDILTILQNRFGEWSADMVNVVQPSIVGAFNSIMSFSQGLAESLTHMWEWLNTDGWGQTAVKIGGLLTAILSVTQAFTMYRTNMRLVELSQLGVKKAIGSVILGLKGQEIAESGVLTTIKAKILGVKAETIADKGVTTAIRDKMTMLKLQTVEEKLNTLSSEENTTAKKWNALQEKINKAEKEGLITTNEAQTLSNKLLTISTEQQAVANSGLTASLYLLGTGEVYVEGTTSALATTMGVLNGVFMMSPIGWITAGILALAGAFYVLSGGLDDSWGKMKQFNEAMEDTDGAMQPHTEYLRQLAKDVGETSDKYKTAKESVDDFYKHLQSGKAQYDKSQLAFENANIGMTDNSKRIFEKYGISDEDKEKYIANFDYLVTGKDKYYKAEQVINKQIYDENSNFATNLDSLINQMGKDNPRLEEEIGKLQGNYQNLAEHSYIANTTDDWWEWMWNSLYAGMDQFWIDWDNFWRDPQWSSGIDGLIRGLETSNPFGGILKALGIDYDNVGKQITDFFNGIGAYFKGKSLMELLGLDPNYDYVGEWWQGWFGNIDWNQVLTDCLKAVANINIFDIILDALLPSGVSASDGSSDHPPVMDEISQVLGGEIQGWVDRFNADPLGTLGLVIAPLNLTGLFSSLFGDMGGINLGDWLNNLFDISGWISSFTINLDGIISSVSSTATSVMDSFNGMKTTVSTNIGNIVSNATQGFQTVYTNSKNSLNNLRDTTSQVIHSMVDAWNGMKDKILDCAKQIWDGVKSRFDSISDTIGGFYHKIINPSSWAGSPSLKNSGTPRPSVGRSVAKTITGRGYAGGRGSSAPSGSMSISQLKRILCPDGNCGNLFDGYSNTDVVDASSFLALVGQGHGFGGWDFSSIHKNYIRDKSNKWETGSPIIKLLGGIATSTKFNVGEFENGSPKITFEQFKSMAEAIFNAIPYRFYFDSSWKGSWLGALQAGACNCYDGALALIAFANACGFSGSMNHGTWTDPDGSTYPHVWATINGMKMDVTGWQQRKSWSAGGNVSSVKTSKPQASNNAPVVNVTINGNVYGVDDLNSQIEEGIDKGLQKHFNKSYALGV